jgi:hypothetical protein
MAATEGIFTELIYLDGLILVFVPRVWKPRSTAQLAEIQINSKYDKEIRNWVSKHWKLLQCQNCACVTMQSLN